MRHATHSLGSILLWVAGLLASSLAGAQQATIVGILEGNATLVRQTTRYALAEGMALNDQDIVETAAGAFAQIELPGGVLVGLGESTRVMLRPHLAKSPSRRGAPEATTTTIPLYLLEGWLKTSSSGAFGYASPAFEIATQAATSVVHLAGAQYEVFLEGGTAKLTPREGGQGALQLAGGDFVQRREGTMPQVARRAGPEFLARLPRQFRDRLPARAEQLARRNVVPKPLGEIAYTDVAPWLRTEPAVRLPLLPLWKARASDLSFRAAAKADLAQHPEWEPYADPEGYARKLALEAERRRAREAARQAAKALAAASAANAASAATTARSKQP